MRADLSTFYGFPVHGFDIFERLPIDLAYTIEKANVGEGACLTSFKIRPEVAFKKSVMRFIQEAAYRARVLSWRLAW